MKKEENILKRIISLMILLLFLNIGNYVYTNSFQKVSLTGNVIDEMVSPNDSITGNLIKTEVLEKKGEVTTYLLFLQWSLLLVLFIYAFFKRKQVTIDSIELKKVMVPSKQGRQKTDLDTLYEYLSEKGQIKIIEVMKMFNIKKDIAMEWGKILESGDLAEIDYPMMRGPIIKFKEHPNDDKDNGRHYIGLKHDKMNGHLKGNVSSQDNKKITEKKQESKVPKKSSIALTKKTDIKKNNNPKKTKKGN